MTATPVLPQIPILESGTPARAGLIRVGTRGSRLAVAQSAATAHEIALRTGAEVGLVIVRTHGDVTSAPLSQLGGTGVFVSALRTALLEGRCDAAVHSLKDLPTAETPGVRLGAVPPRADARDVLVARDGLTLDELPSGASVGTGSPRRAAQLLSRRPDLDVRDIRGNVDSRLARVGVDLDAIILAAAGLDRLGLGEAITERFELDRVPTAPGQGALAVEARESDTTAMGLLEAVDDHDSHLCVAAERSLLAALEAGCAAPVGARAAVHDGDLRLTGAVYSLDGSRTLTRTLASGSDSAEELGIAVAQDLLDRGARDIAPLGSAR